MDQLKELEKTQLFLERTEIRLLQNFIRVIELNERIVENPKEENETILGCFDRMIQPALNEKNMNTTKAQEILSLDEPQIAKNYKGRLRLVG